MSILVGREVSTTQGCLKKLLKTGSMDFHGHQKIAAMPPAMSHEWFGKKVDINCVGTGHQLLVCLNSGGLFSYVLCDVVTNEWVELPKCCVNGKAIEFMSAFSFEPRIKATV